MTQQARKHRKLLIVTAAVAVAALTLLAAPPTSGQDEPAGEFRRFIRTMNAYLTVTDQWVDVLDRPEAATFMAVEGIVEVYEARGEKRKAIPHLKRLLEEHGDSLAVSNAIRFKLRDLYKDLMMPDEALAELDRIVAQNAERAD